MREGGCMCVCGWWGWGGGVVNVRKGVCEGGGGCEGVCVREGGYVCVMGGGVVHVWGFVLWGFVLCLYVSFNRYYSYILNNIP